MTRLARVEDPDGRASWARLREDRVELVDGDPFLGDDLRAAAAREVLALESVRFLAPARPTKILGIGRNYRDHAREMDNPVPERPLIFLKAPSALLDPGGTVALPPESRRVDFEGELAMIIGRRCRRWPAASWREVVLGWTLACDVTARDLQKVDGQFARAKSFDTFCPLGPVIELDREPLGLETRVNGVVRQRGRLEDLVFAPGVLVEALSAAMTLLPGDVILTGTPAGVGPLAAGDQVEVESARIGVLAFGVADED